MWICLNNAFLSVVESDDPNYMMVRARSRQHLVNTFPGERIHVTPRNDYRFRVIVARTEVAEMLAQAVLDMDYSNFKNSTRGFHLHSLYEKFWFLHRRFQDGRLT